MSKDDEPIEIIRRALTGLRFGEVVISIHEGEIVQVSRTEKIRTANGHGSRNSRTT